MKYVWYASYGSNVNRDRFFCYIQGGIPKGSQKAEVGCRDSSLPTEDRPIRLDYPLYFAEYSGRWGGAPAFISHQPIGGTVTLGRMYKITEEQFLDVVKQENNGSDFSLNLNEIMKIGAQTFSKTSWYGRIVYIGDEDDFPVFTFTAPWRIEHANYLSPSREYLISIMEGIKQVYDRSNQSLVEYFLTKPGVKDHWSQEELEQLVSSIV